METKGKEEINGEKLKFSKGTREKPKHEKLLKSFQRV